MAKTRASTSGGTSLIPGQGAKTPHATQHGQKLKERKKERKKCGESSKN